MKNVQDKTRIFTSLQPKSLAISFWASLLM